MAEQHRIFVSNLPFMMDTDDLRTLAAQFGQVIDSHILADRLTGRPRGIGFVGAATADDAAAIIAGMSGLEHLGRTIRAEPALPRK